MEEMNETGVRRSRRCSASARRPSGRASPPARCAGTRRSGLLVPSGHSAGGARRYSRDDLERIVHIRELQSLLGLDLGEIRDILVGEEAWPGCAASTTPGPRRPGDGRSSSRRRPSTRSCGRWWPAARTTCRQMMRSLEEKATRYAELLAELGERVAHRDG